jgi:thymidylate synthase (FAD)
MRYIYNDEIGSVELIDSMGSDERVVNAARVSFGRDNQETDVEKVKKLINFLARNKHTSPFEHVTATFRIKVPLFIRSQIMRHRTFSYNEISRRYTSDEIELWFPNGWRGQSNKNLQCSSGEITDAIADEIFESSVAMSLQAYHSLLERGIARELARAVLPQSLYTSFYMTGNLHNWSHFLRLRLDAHAQPEVRAVAEAIRDKLIILCPVSMCALLDT